MFILLKKEKNVFKSLFKNTTRGRHGAYLKKKKNTTSTSVHEKKI